APEVTPAHGKEKGPSASRLSIFPVYRRLKTKKGRPDHGCRWPLWCGLGPGAGRLGSTEPAAPFLTCRRFYRESQARLSLGPCPSFVRLAPSARERLQTMSQDRDEQILQAFRWRLQRILDDCNDFINDAVRLGRVRPDLGGGASEGGADVSVADLLATGAF